MPCTKRSYKYKAQAAAAIIKIAKEPQRGKGGKKPIRYYKCEECGRYHLTSKPIEQLQGYYKPKLDWSKLLE
jgi:uncharacterized protein YlaI